MNKLISKHNKNIDFKANIEDDSQTYKGIGLV